MRAVAVVPVILFHAGVEQFSGGYVGVDIFFVISGYLITTLLLEDIEAGKFSLIDFYERRARRILPALFTVILCAIPFAWLWMNPIQLEAFNQNILAATFFYSNFYLLRVSDYFAPAAEENPLMHTWSLSVEEQYYIIAPLVLLFLWRYGRNRAFYVTIALAVLSLLLSEILWRDKPEENFYLLPTRGWELMAGAICAFMLFQKPRKNNEVLALLGMGLIIFAVIAYDRSTPIPSLYALVPVLGTCFIILFGGSGTLAARLLSIKPLVGIGLVSYSAYLWHQPLFAFARLKVGYISELFLICGVGLTFILAGLTWRYIEQPVRRKSWGFLSSTKGVFRAAAASAAVLVVLGFSLDNTKFYRNSLTEYQKQLEPYLSYDRSSVVRSGACFISSKQDDFKLFDKQKCLKIEQDRPNYLLMGDSHAAHHWRALSEKYPNLNIMQATISACRPIRGSGWRKRCTDMLGYIYDDFLPNNRIEGVILSSTWIEIDINQLKNTITYLEKLGLNVIIFGPSMQYTSTVASILFRYREKPDHFEIKRFEKESVRQIHKNIKELVATTNATYYPLYDYMCFDNNCRIFADDGAPMIYDDDHLTLSGARTVLKNLPDQRP